MGLKRITQSIIIIFITNILHAQTPNIRRVELSNDTATYSSLTHSVTINAVKKLTFRYKEDQETFDIKVFPKNGALLNIVPSRDFIIVDSLLNYGEYLRCKVRFSNLTQSSLLRLTFEVTSDSVKTFKEIHLQPVTETKAWIDPVDEQLFIGEEKIYEVYSNNIQNLNISNEWVKLPDLEYRFTKKNDQVFLHIIPKRVGDLTINAPLKAYKPKLTESKTLDFNLSPLSYLFNVKASRLQFLSLDKAEITYSEETRMDGIEVQLESNRFFVLQKTYRIENQEEPGGALIAELFTKRRLANNRILCIIRPYNFHRISDGYLFIKDGDNPRFITNVNVTPATKIKKISILHDGTEWKTSKAVHPGETVDIKLEGEGLHKARLAFEGLIDLTSDTLIRNENELYFKLKVPIDITKKKLNIYNYNNPTGELLTVGEFQRPKELDFVYINYGDFGRRLSGVKEPILYDDIIRDIIFSFNNSKIDDEKLYGKQYLNLKIQITDKRNQLIELKTIDNIVICPSEDSPRGKYYNSRDCYTGDLSLNKEIRKPTYNLDEWSRIKITVSHDKSKYGGNGYSKEVEIILKRNFSFDVEVSFPAGLLTIYPGDTTKEIGGLSGISMAMIAQFSFYHPEKINSFRPFKVGAGFLALNAFNLSEGMDLGVVVLGSVYPTTKDTKFSFPLYLGAGYNISGSDEKLSPAQRFFFMIGPGIRVRF